LSTIYSMTGFASVRSGSEDGASFTLSLKGVNHRFLDLSFRLPSNCDALEIQLRRELKSALIRGHVDVTLQMERRVNMQVQLNHSLLEAYMTAFRQAVEQYGGSPEPDINAMLRIPGVMSVESSPERTDSAAFDAAVLALLPELVASFNAVRAQEGASLVTELRASMLKLQEYATEIATLRGEVRDAQMQRLRTRLTELLQGATVSEERILEEAAVLAERGDIEEEVVRLRTHVDRFLAMLDEGGEVGKKMDFLLQELNREANTMLSKTGGAAGSNGLRITELGLGLKSEIEKAREQVQNLE
jgi:uncharacterized protein (TIGR00255 family)